MDYLWSYLLPKNPDTFNLKCYASSYSSRHRKKFWNLEGGILALLHSLAPVTLSFYKVKTMVLIIDFFSFSFIFSSFIFKDRQFEIIECITICYFVIFDWFQHRLHYFCLPMSFLAFKNDILCLVSQSRLNNHIFLLLYIFTGLTLVPDFQKTTSPFYFFVHEKIFAGPSNQTS